MTVTLSRDEFGERFLESFRVLWVVAAGVIGDRTSVEDVLQEACVIGLQKLDRFDPATSFSAWMGSIVRFVSLNHRRTRNRHEPERRDPDALRADDPHAGLEFDDGLRSALQVLKPTPRSCLLLRTVLELSYREIGELLDIPEPTATSHVHRARRELRRRLTEQPIAEDVKP